jgi:hypothetical protein
LRAVGGAPVDGIVFGQSGRTAMATIAINWSAYDLKEKAFERALAEGTAILSDHPLPSGGFLRNATDEELALAAKQFEQRGQDLIAIAEWLRAKRSSNAKLGGRSAPFFRDLVRALAAFIGGAERYRSLFRMTDR